MDSIHSHRFLRGGIQEHRRLGGKEYTTEDDFNEGSLTKVKVVGVGDDALITLEGKGEPINFLWVAKSGTGTIVKIETKNGVVMGEYRSAPQGMGLNPSRTTVDANGNVWAGNRNEDGWLNNEQSGSVVKIGLKVSSWDCKISTARRML